MTMKPLQSPLPIFTYSSICFVVCPAKYLQVFFQWTNKFGKKGLKKVKTSFLKAGLKCYYGKNIACLAACCFYFPSCCDLYLRNFCLALHVGIL